MPTVEGRILVSLSPLVNIDLFKRGHYHVSCRLTDPSLQGAGVSLLAIKDIFGSISPLLTPRNNRRRSNYEEPLTDHAFPGACKLEDRFITQTTLIEYTEQSFVLGEYFLFGYTFTINNDYNELYIPVNLTLTLELMYSGEEELPTDPTLFEKIATRSLNLNIDWRCGLHGHWPVMFDYFHMAAIGVTTHASLYSITPDTPTLIEDTPLTPSKRGWLFTQATPTTTPISYYSMLFGAPPTNERDPAFIYAVPDEKIRRARQVHREIAAVLMSARDSLRHDFQVMSGECNVSEALSNGPYESGTTLDEVEEECRVHMASLSIQLQATWAWFCRSAVSHPDMINHLAGVAHDEKVARLRKTFLWPDQIDARSLVDAKCTYIDHSNSHWVSTVANAARRSIVNLPKLYCVENIETQSNACVVLVEPCPWATRRCSLMSTEPDDRYKFQKHISPYLMSALPSNRRHRQRHHPSNLHLIVCVHGLQGNHFDLRLYRTYLELALPLQKLEFLMSEANLLDTFTDFNIMTDRLEKELLSKLVTMPHPPTHISFLAHSLGGIVVRSLVTRQAVAHLIPTFHFFLSICGPHLGTQLQTGIVSAGMWFIQKFRQSQSLLQLSLKDAPNFRDTFLYQLSEAQTFECFKHVVLLTSPQDKYVPCQSARLSPGGDTSSLLGKLHEDMASRMMSCMEQFGVNLLRVTVHHMLPTSAHTVIGRAAHIAMLDNELFVEKFIYCLIARFFISEEEGVI